MLTVDFHCHTCYSKDSLTHLEDLLAACRQKHIDRLVITDHNTISGALRAQEMDPQRIIVGEEIMTQAGELLAAFVEKELPMGLTPLEAIARLRDQGAFISISHPFDRWREGHWELSDLLRVIPLVDAIETYNARCVQSGFNTKAQSFAQQHNLAGTAGSDAHTSFEVGRALLQLPDFQDTQSLIAGLRQAHCRCRLSPWWVHFASSYASWYKRQA